MFCADESVRAIDKALGGESHFWLQWYAGFLGDYIKFMKALRVVPGRLMSEKYRMKPYVNAISKLKQDGCLAIKDIKLPLPHNGVDSNEYITFFNAIVEGLFAYTLEGLDDEAAEQIFRPVRDLKIIEGPYEHENVRIEDGDIVIDAGANIGEFSALAGAKGKAAYAFEPMPEIIDLYLKRTAEENPNVTICEYALSDKPGQVVFNKDSNGIDGSSFVINSDSAEKITVQTIDLDSFVERSNLPKVDFIKADIEGAERNMLMGARRVLKEFAPKLSLCTYHLPDDPQVMRALILDANPDYVIEEKWNKMYAYAPKACAAPNMQTKP